MPTNQLSQQPVKPKPRRMGAPCLVRTKVYPFGAGPPWPLAHLGFSVACESQSEHPCDLPLPLLFLFFTAGLF